MFYDFLRFSHVLIAKIHDISIIIVLFVSGNFFFQSFLKITVGGKKKIPPSPQNEKKKQRKREPVKPAKL